ncbi:MAG: prepilin-type N-terminal cleavage/methylation domain-containing protein [Lentisphaerae bacterium]|nr:prepilin-type N-terminal cleavage/methylation domain-containing protein [Lentisphaerota bacterium]
MKNINFQNRKMFTLIELLVVIAIIAILAAILLPALNSARERGRDADCKSQLKQLATAEEFYCSDFDDFITPLRSKFPGFAEWSYAALLWKQGYLGVTSLFICPSMADFQYDTEVRNQTFSKSAPYQLNWISYGINAAVGSEIYISQGQVEGPAYKRGKVLAPSQTFLFSETRYDVRRGRYFITSISDTADGNMENRHAGNANIAWIDGHVSQMQDAATILPGFDGKGTARANLLYMNPEYRP